MEQPSKTNAPNESGHSERDIKPSMQLAATQGSLSREITRRNMCTASSSSQSQTEHQQIQARSSSAAEQDMFEIHCEEGVKISLMALRKAESERGVPALTLLPSELWLKVFLYCVSADGALPFLTGAARVCRLWRDLTREPVLWEKLDLSHKNIKQNDESLEWLVHNRLSNCKEIILEDWGCETDDAVEMITRHCPQLQIMDLSGSRMLSSDGINSLFRNCRNLRSLNLSRTSPCAISALVSYARIGFRWSLECISLSGNEMESLSADYEEIVHNSPQLRELRLGSRFDPWMTLSISPLKLQMLCPLLQVLDLHNVPINVIQSSQAAMAQASGLVHLRELRCSNTFESLPLVIDVKNLDFLLKELLHNSARFKVLDMSGYSKFCGHVLLSLPVESLEELNLSKTGVTTQVLRQIFVKWGHSLKNVNLNYVDLDPRELESALTILTSPNLFTSPLRELHLFPCKISRSCVRLLTGKLKQLEVLKIANTHVPPGIDLRQTGREVMKRLHQHICELENWCHSLERVDLSYNMYLDPGELEAACTILTDLPTCPLRKLSLFPCSTSLSCVKMITGKLKCLEILDIACVGVPREFGRWFTGRESMEWLHQRVCELEKARMCCFRLSTGKLKLEVLKMANTHVPPGIDLQQTGWQAMKRLHQHMCELENEPECN